jgi:hypothetical protein
MVPVEEIGRCDFIQPRNPLARVEVICGVVVVGVSLAVSNRARGRRGICWRVDELRITGRRGNRCIDGGEAGCCHSEQGCCDWVARVGANVSNCGDAVSLPELEVGCNWRQSLG